MQTNRTQNKPAQRVTDLYTLQSENDRRLSRYAQLQFGLHINKEWQREKEHKTFNGLVPSHFFWGDAVKLGTLINFWYNSYIII